MEKDTPTGHEAPSPPHAGAVLALSKVQFGYEPTHLVINDVTTALSRGRLTALIGPNAAGKSTLLKLMLGQLNPWRGSATLLGQNVASLSPRPRAARISYVPQRGLVSFSFTVRQVVEMGRYAQGADASAVTEALRLCDLCRLEDRIFAHLSGGQQQQVLVARAIAQSWGTGRAMLLDEPATGMDLHHLHHLMRILRQLAGSGLAVLTVLHDLNLAARYADEVWLMNEGRLLASGPWDRVLQPDLLEPVYRVRLRRLATLVQPSEGPADARPLFLVDLDDTLR